MKVGLLGEFSFTAGLGHFFRLKGLHDGLHNLVEPKFYFQSLQQKRFLAKQRIKAHDTRDFDCDFMIYDGRNANAQSFDYLKLPPDNCLLIDNLENTNNYFGSAVFPSFYLSSSNQKTLHRNFRNVHQGNGYFFVRASAASTFRGPLVTFGGSDPNNITLKVAEILGDNASYIVGPLYNTKRLQELRDIVSEKNIILSPPTTFRYIEQAQSVITALGTTLQEIELIQKKCFIIANYETDIADFTSILKCSANKDLYSGFCHHNDMVDDEIIQFLKEQDIKGPTNNFDVINHNNTAAQLWMELLR